MPVTESLLAGGVVLRADELEARWADAWRPEQVAERLEGVAAPWCIAAGWALDLFRGRQSRPHGDVEIAVPAAEFSEIQDRFPEGVFDAVGSGRVWAEAGAPLRLRGGRAAPAGHGVAEPLRRPAQ
ncbi:nucleotidyltransferase domain-containing protein [Streptomyces sp. B21-083]|uniref:nucleotidyltransferase domain-containing protein n=1 Tax=Streptomyces sp. B21-083 TaxID=3039410 RepID=UPI003FA68599